MCYNTKLFRELNTSLFLSDPRAPCFVFIRHEETRLLSPCKLDDVIQEEEAGTGRQVGSQVKKRNKCRNHPATPGGVGTKRRITRTEENVFLSSGAESDRQSAVSTVLQSSESFHSCRPATSSWQSKIGEWRYSRTCTH